MEPRLRRGAVDVAVAVVVRVERSGATAKPER